MNEHLAPEEQEKNASSRLIRITRREAGLYLFSLSLVTACARSETEGNVASGPKEFVKEIETPDGINKLILPEGEKIRRTGHYYFQTIPTLLDDDPLTVRIKDLTPPLVCELNAFIDAEALTIVSKLADNPSVFTNVKKMSSLPTAFKQNAANLIGMSWKNWDITHIHLNGHSEDVRHIKGTAPQSPPLRNPNIG